MKIMYIYPCSCEYAYPEYLNPKLPPDKFDLEIMCNADLELRYLRGLSELGEECVLFYPRRFHLPIKEFMHRGGYRIVRFPVSFFEGQNGLEFSSQMLKYLNKEKPDLVHFLGIYGGKYLYIRFFDIVAYYCKLNRIPFFGWYHVGSYPRGRRFPFLWYPARLITAATLRNCAGITSVNHRELSRLFEPQHPEYYGIDFSKVPNFLASNTYDPNKFFSIQREEALRKLSLSQDKRYMLMVARIFFEKGLHHLLNVMPELIRRFPDIHLLVVGEFIKGAENYRLMIDQMIENLGIKERVTFLGRIEHWDGLVYYYSSADVLVSPSLQETFGAVNLEAIGCGTPVVSTDCGEIPYYLKSGVGIVVPPGDESSLLNALDHVMSGGFAVDPEERKDILAKYDYRLASLELRNWYKKILNERKEKARG